jgi:soluble lytic murein transglycosylase-like protein
LYVIVLIALLLVQDVRSQADRIRAAMEPSLAKQRASVRAQVEAAATHLTSSTSSASWSIPMIMPEGVACEAVSQPELARLIDDIAPRQNVDPALVREVARQESGFHPCAVSPKGAAGLMQLMPATQAQFQVKNPFDAKESLEAGSKLLRDLLDRYHGDLSLALSAYNAGPQTVDKAGAVPEIPETKNYVFGILNRLTQQ